MRHRRQAPEGAALSDYTGDRAARTQEVER